MLYYEKIQNPKSKIQNPKKLILIAFVFSILSACNKPEESLLNGQNNKHSAAREAGATTDNRSFDIANMDNPMRDVVEFVKNGGRLPDTKYFKDYREMIGRPKVVGNGSWPYGCANNLLLLGYPGATCGGGSSSLQGSNANNLIDCPTYIQDAFGNKIYALAMYGPDARQGYYVYLPDNVNPNSKIVVLIHGGGWISGPDPELVNGWGSSYAASNPQQNNIVKNLLMQGYVVVVPLYRLASYGDNPTDIVASPVTVLDQVDDIDAAITHVRTNFPTCLEINANNIQVMGESAGGNLALLFAYTRANTSYIKSVVSVAAPTNMNQYAAFISNKTLINPFLSQNCGADYVYNNINSTNITHYPFYGFYDPTPDLPTFTVTGYTNPQNFNCNIANIYLGAILISNSSQNIDKRRTDNYRLAQSIVRQNITDPATNVTFQNISPCSTLVATRIIPTFIIHGTSDELVPYTQATNTMNTRLTNFGGLIGTYFSNNNSTNPIPASNTYASNPLKHLIKQFNGAGHGVSVHVQTQPDILTWLNGH